MATELLRPRPGPTEAGIAALKMAPELPARFIPSAEGGVAIHFSLGEKSAEVEFTNANEIIALTYSANDAPRAWELLSEQIPDAFRQISSFLRGRGVNEMAAT